jgi:hypothetical protein
MIQSRDYKTLDGQSALYNEIITEIDANDEYIRTASNTGTGSEVFKQSSNQDLQFRKLKSTTLTITQNADDISIEEDGKQQLDDGDQKSPSLYFSNDTDTGIYREGANAIGFTTNGSQKLHIHNLHLEAFQPLRLPLGSVSSPSLTFSGDTNTGIYSSTGDAMSLVCGGNSIITLINNDKINTNFQIQAADANGKVAYAFNGDDDTGLQWVSTNAFKMISGGGDVAECNVNNFVLYKPLISNVQPYSVYYRNADQTSLTGLTTLLYDTKEQEYSSQITFSSGVYTVTNAGTYLVNADMQIIKTTAGTIDVSAFFTINNSATNRSGYQISRAQGVHLMSLSNIIYLAANDTIRVQIIPSDNAYFEVSDNGIRRPRFSILRIF